MATDRVSIRLDAERAGKLKELAKADRVSISEFVRRLIDAGYARNMRDERASDRTSEGDPC